MDERVALAKKSLENFIIKGEIIDIPKDLSDELIEEKAGCFVTIYKNGELRGCIGTIEATQDSLAEEIIKNAISSGTKDPRFPQVRENELDSLTYSVDVLGEAEEIDSFDQLDIEKYGVIVSSGFRRGLLLPDIDGVDSVKMQVDISLKKAGISPDEDYKLERFEVIRYV